MSKATPGATAPSAALGKSPNPTRETGQAANGQLPNPTGTPLQPVQIPVPKSREEAEGLFTLMAFNDALLCGSEKGMALDLALVREKHDLETALIRETYSAQRAALAAWSEKNKKHYFNEPRCIETIHGRFGFRLSAPSLVLMAKASWKDVLAKLKGALKIYRRPKVEVDRAAMLADARGNKPKLTAAKLKAIGLEIAQEDGFFVELKGN